MKRFVSLHLVPAYLWLFLITYLSLFKGNSSVKIEIPHLDKVVHFVFYFGLVYLFARGLHSVKEKVNMYIVVIMAILYGGLIELVQMQTGYRSGDIFDFIANSSGAIMAFILFQSIENIVHKLFNKKNTQKG